jgi:hypothetical protein
VKKYLFFILLFYILFLSVTHFPAYADNHKLILGAKVPLHFTVRTYSPHVPIPGEDTGDGIGIGFYAEVIPYRYIAIESGFYVRKFSLGDDVILYNEMHVPIVIKLRFPVVDIFAISLGGGVTYCYPLSGKIYLTLGGDSDPMEIPEQDLITDFGILIKAGFQLLLKDIVFNIDLGMEFVDKPIEIEQTDFALTFGIGFGLF